MRPLDVLVARRKSAVSASTSRPMRSVPPCTGAAVAAGAGVLAGAGAATVLAGAAGVLAAGVAPPPQALSATSKTITRAIRLRLSLICFLLLIPLLLY